MNYVMSIDQNPLCKKNNFKAKIYLSEVLNFSIRKFTDLHFSFKRLMKALHLDLVSFFNKTFRHIIKSW